VLAEEWMTAAEASGKAINGDMGKGEPIDNLGISLLGNRA
jgi:hypothetical protein